MPAKSVKQHNFMRGVASGSIGGGPSEAVAKEFVKKTPKDKRSAFGKALKKKKKSDY